MSQQQRAAQIFNDLAKSLVQLSELFLVPDALPQPIHQDEKPQRKKVEKDPNAPKRNLSSYMLYSQAVRPDTVEKHPELKAVDVAKMIGEMWNALSDKEKQPFVKQAEKEKARFDKETQKYKATLGEDHQVATKRKAAEIEAPSKKKSKDTKESKDAAKDSSKDAKKKKSKK